MARSRRILKLFSLRSRPSDLGPVQLWVRSPRRRRNRWLGLLIMAIGIWAGMGLLLLSLRWGFHLMFNPQALPELRGLLQSPSPSVKTVTLNELNATAAKAQERLGEPLEFGLAGSQARYWLLPVYAAATDTLSAVSIYQLQGPDSEQLRFVTQLSVASIPEAEAFRPLLGTPQAPPLRQQPLPLAEVAPAGQPGWFLLEGRWRRSGIDLRYGRMIFFDADTQTLEAVMTWSSPAAQPPQWADLDGSGFLDLLIDESAGLEPALRGIQVFEQAGLGPSLRLQPVSLVTVPVDSHVADYRQALILAQAGLWSEAVRQIQSLKPQIKFWPAAAEAQLRLIDRHASRARQQADQTWSSPNQKILAQLIDGRWQAALTTLRAAPEALEPLQRLLAQDEGRIWNRVSASLRLNPQDEAALVWGALILQAEKDTSTAVAWLDQRQADPAAKQQFQAVLALAANQWAAGRRERSQPAPSPQPGTLAADGSPEPGRSQRSAAGPVEAALGTARAVGAIQPDEWYWASGPVELGANQTWYAIDLIGQLQTDWFTTAPPQSEAETWRQLAPMTQSMQLLPRSDSGTSIPLELRGLRQRGTQLTLLASGSAEALPLTTVALAYSPGSLAWLNPQTGLKAAGQANLRQGLKSALGGQSVETSTLDRVITQAAYYPLVLDSQAAQVLLLERAAIDILIAAGVRCDRNTPKALIVRADGSVSYSNLFTPETLVAVTDLGPPQLLIWTGSGYQMGPYRPD